MFVKLPIYVQSSLAAKSFHSIFCVAISACSPQWINEVVSGYQHDESALSMMAKLSIDPNAVPHFTLQNGLLR